MSAFFTPVLPSSFLALATTVHLALSALRHHRRPGPGVFSSLTAISGTLALAPWFFPSLLGVGAGVALHALWFGACERIVVVQRSRGPGVQGSKGPGVQGAPPIRAKAARPSGFVQAPVLAVFEETPEIRTFRIARPDGFDFTAGQFLPIRLRCDGRDLVRCYSISSAPASSGYLEISVKRQGTVSNTLHAIVRPGTQVSVRAPAGSFTYPAGDDRPILLIAGGIGITPLLSMLRHGVDTEPGRPIALIYSAATADGLAFRDDIRALCGRHPQARAFFTVTQGGGTPELYAGRIDETLLCAAMPNLRDAIAMICGPQPMIAAMRHLLSSLGVPPPQIRSELFEAAVAASTGHQPDTAPVAAARSGFDVRCVKSRTSIRAAANQTLLEAAEAAGVAIESLCRAGLCGTCRTRVVEGDVACDSTVLAVDDRDLGYVLACVAHARTDCAIEA